MKEKIIQYLMENPESRKRDIAYYLKVWQCDATFLSSMRELKQEGRIKSTYHRIPENMEFYDTFSVIGT